MGALSAVAAGRRSPPPPGDRAPAADERRRLSILQQQPLRARPGARAAEQFQDKTTSLGACSGQAISPGRMFLPPKKRGIWRQRVKNRLTEKKGHLESRWQRL